MSSLSHSPAPLSLHVFETQYNPFRRLAVPFRWNPPFLPLTGHQARENRQVGLSGLSGLSGWIRLTRGPRQRQAEANRFNASEVFTTQVPSNDKRESFFKFDYRESPISQTISLTTDGRSVGGDGLISSPSCLCAG